MSKVIMLAGEQCEYKALDQNRQIILITVVSLIHHYYCFLVITGCLSKTPPPSLNGNEMLPAAALNYSIWPALLLIAPIILA